MSLRYPYILSVIIFGGVHFYYMWFRVYVVCFVENENRIIDLKSIHILDVKRADLTKGPGTQRGK